MRAYDNSIHMMDVLGGSFIKALANLYYVSDSENRVKLRQTFSTYFEDYRKRFNDLKLQNAKDAHYAAMERWDKDPTSDKMDAVEQTRNELQFVRDTVKHSYD